MTPRALSNARRLATLLAVFVLVAVTTTGVVAGQNGPTVHLSDVKLAPGETGTVTVSITGLENGLAGYWTMIVASDVDVVSITNVTHVGPLQSTADPTYAADNSSVNVSAPDRYRTVQPGDADVTLLNLTVRAGSTPGEATLGVPLHQIHSDAGERITPSIEGGRISVHTPSTVRVSDREITAGETATLDVSIADLPYGLSEYDMTLAVGNRSVGYIRNVTYSDALATTEDPVFADDRSTVTIAARDTAESVGRDAGATPLVTVTIQAQPTDANTTLGVSSLAFVDDDGDRMEPIVSAGLLEVTPPNPFDGENLLRTLLMVSIGGIVLVLVAFARFTGIA